MRPARGACRQCLPQSPAGTEVRQRLRRNTLPLPVPSDTRSPGRLCSATLRETTLPVGTAPPRAAAELTTMPPENGESTVDRLPNTWLRMTVVPAAPASQIPVPD